MPYRFFKRSELRSKLTIVMKKGQNCKIKLTINFKNIYFYCVAELIIHRQLS